MISAIQYTLVERLVSELCTSILTPSSMFPQHVPIGAWNTEQAVKLLSLESNTLVVAIHSTPVFTYMLETADWSSNCVIATDIPTPVKALCRDHWKKQETVESWSISVTHNHHYCLLITYLLLIWAGSAGLLGTGRKQPTLPWEAVSVRLSPFLLEVCPLQNQSRH